MPLIPALGRQRQSNLWVQDQPGLQSEFQDSQSYTEKPCLEKQTNENVFIFAYICVLCVCPSMRAHSHMWKSEDRFLGVGSCLPPYLKWLSLLVVRTYMRNLVQQTSGPEVFLGVLILLSQLPLCHRRLGDWPAICLSLSWLRGSLLLVLGPCLFCFWDWALLCTPGQLGTHSNPLSSATQVSVTHRHPQAFKPSS